MKNYSMTTIEHEAKEVGRFCGVVATLGAIAAGLVILFGAKK
jgi:hypothetical protein